MRATRIAKCRTCRAEFTSERANNGKWQRTCSIGIRFAEALTDQADKLEEQRSAKAGGR